MSFFLRRGVMSSAALSGGTIYSASTANLTPASSHYFSAGNNFNIGSGEFGFSFWFKFDTLSGNMVLLGKYNSGAGNASYYFVYLPGSNILRLDVSTTGNGVTNSYDVSFTATAGTWYHAVVTRVSNTLHTYIDGVDQGTNGMTGITVHASTTAFDVGALGTYNVLYTDGAMYGVAAMTGDHFDSTDVSNLYGSGSTQVPCYESLPSVTKNKIDSYWRIGNYDTNSGSELTDLAGAINLTNPNSAPFTGTGLSVEC